jgi:rod shape-determining protein MreC
MLKRPHYIALSLVVVLALILLNLPSQTATHFKLALGGLFLPMVGLAGSMHTLVEQTASSLGSQRSLLTQIEQLRRENSQFRTRDAQVAQIWRENEQLRQALRLQKQLPWKLQYARVVVRDPANWWRTIQIDAGQREGIRPELPVLTLDGVLVGRVTEVSQGRSRIALVGDPDCQVPADVEDGATRDFGIIASGAGSVLDASLVNLTFVNHPLAMKPGQRVVTSSRSRAFPKGIVIGQIVDTNSVDFGLYTEARVKLAANLESLDEVWVILP